MRSFQSQQNALTIDRLKSLQSGVINEKFANTKFLVGREEIEFHIIGALLASISPVFEVMLFGNMSESQSNPEIRIPDIQPTAFRSVIDYAYCNTPEIKEDNVVAIYQVCDKYQINELAALCEQFIDDFATEANICLLFNDAVNLKQAPLLKKCQFYQSKFAAGAKCMFQSEAFSIMSVNAMNIFLQCDNLKITEENIWQCVVKWAAAQVYNTMKNENGTQHDEKCCELMDEESKSGNLAVILKAISRSIRFGLMEAEYFMKHVKPLIPLTEKERLSILTYQLTNEGDCAGFCTAVRDASNRKLDFLRQYTYFPKDDPEDSEYHEDNDEDCEQYRCDQEEDIMMEESGSDDN